MIGNINIQHKMQTLFGYFATKTKKYMQNTRRLIYVLPLLLIFSGCASILGPAPTRIQLHPRMPEAGKTASSIQMIVAKPHAGRDLDTDSMALLFNEREIRYLYGLRWNMPLPSLLQTKLIESLQAANILRGVADEITGINAQVRLLCNMQQFSLQYSNEGEGTPPTAVIELTLQLVNQRNGALMGTKNISAHVVATGINTPQLIQAYEDALSVTLAESVDWIKNILPNKISRN